MKVINNTIIKTFLAVKKLNIWLALDLLTLVILLNPSLSLRIHTHSRTSQNNTEFSEKNKLTVTPVDDLSYASEFNLNKTNTFNLLETNSNHFDNSNNNNKNHSSIESLLNSKYKHPKKSLTNDKDPLASLSNEEIENMLKQLDNKSNNSSSASHHLHNPAISNNSVGIKPHSNSITSTNNLLSPEALLKDDTLGIDFSQDPISNLLDLNTPGFKTKEENKIMAIVSENKNALRKFKMKEKDAFNLIRMLQEKSFFSRLPTTARNIISVN